MELKARFAREAILEKDDVNHLKIDLCPEKREFGAGKKPAAIVFVIDRSGSMSDIASKPDYSSGSREYNPVRRRTRMEYASKMDYAVDAVVKFLNFLTPRDIVGVVSFDDIAVVEQSLIEVTQSNTAQIVQNVRNITPRGCTNISDGLKTAKKVFEQIEKGNYNCKIILLSDGLANKGVSSADGLSTIALDCVRSGFTVSSLGIGLDYDSGTMGGIADGGGGLFYHLEDLSQLENVFREELDLTNSVSARDTRVYINIPDLIEISENLNGYPQKVEDNQIEIFIGDMYGPRSMILEISNNFVKEDISFTIKVLYRDIDNTEQAASITVPLAVVSSAEELEKSGKDEETIKLALSLMKDSALLQSSSAYDRGDVRTAANNLNASRKAMKDMSVNYCISPDLAGVLYEEFEEVADAFQNRAASKALAKEIYAKSNRRRKE